MDPKLKVISLSVDSYDRFKAQSIKALNNFHDQERQWPQAILIDTPRDEETKHLHEIYGVLEKLNDGYLTSYFGGNEQKLTMDIGIPIIIFSNSVPTRGALSDDRWDIFSIHNIQVEQEDYILMKATVESWINSYSRSTVTWQNKVITTVPGIRERKSDLSTYESDDMLLKMYILNKETIKKFSGSATETWITNPNNGSKTKKYKNGIIESYGEERAATLNNAPEVVIKWYTHMTQK